VTDLFVSFFTHSSLALKHPSHIHGTACLIFVAAMLTCFKNKMRFYHINGSHIANACNWRWIFLCEYFERWSL